MKPTALVLLYGNYAYDGRARRMYDLLSSNFDCRVLSVSEDEDPQPSATHVTLIQLDREYGVIRRHLSFWKHAIMAARRMRPDIVVAENFFTTLPGYLSAIVGRARLIYDAYELIIPEVGARLPWRDWIWYRLERLVVKRCDVIIAANPERAALMQDHYRLAQRPEYMRNIPAQRCPAELEIERVRAQYPALWRKSEDERILIYQGHLSAERGLMRFIEAMEYLPESWRLVIVGDGPDLPRLNAAAAPFSARGRYHAIGRIPNDQLAPITAACDVGIVTYPFKGLNNIYCAPNKIYEYFLAGLPVIASGQPTIRALIEALPFGTVFDEDASPQRLAAQIIEGATIEPPQSDKIAAIVAREQSICASGIVSKIANSKAH